MDRDIEVVEQWSRLEITFRGPVSFDDRLATLGVVCPLMIKGKLMRVLIDYSHAWVHEPSASAFEQLDARLRRERCLKGCRVALVNPPEFHAVPTEVVGGDMGFSVRRFYSRASALAWLERGPRTSH